MLELAPGDMAAEQIYYCRSGRFRIFERRFLTAGIVTKVIQPFSERLRDMTNRRNPCDSHSDSFPAQRGVVFLISQAGQGRIDGRQHALP
ncbi:hypothetical protein [Defluviimonas sp. WL0050]|uniref:hypothetical protein n=1 Tax=Albidovulum litorale TaxID=2984134 RepID=UPI0021E96651|nr:hypothetical protein [Defluviimonas sp. WL0050]